MIAEFKGVKMSYQKGSQASWDNGGEEAQQNWGPHDKVLHMHSALHKKFKVISYIAKEYDDIRL